MYTWHVQVFRLSPSSEDDLWLVALEIEARSGEVVRSEPAKAASTAMLNIPTRSLRVMRGLRGTVVSAPVKERRTDR
jgi:hypothetical protein